MAAAPAQQWRSYRSALVAGLVLFVAGGVGIQTNGGLTDAQWPASAEAFNAHVAADVDAVRAANLADMVLFVPGYVLLALGVAAWIRSSSGAQGRLGQVVAAAFGLVVVGAVLDTIENVVLRNATGNLPVSDSFVTTLKTLGAAKYVTALAGSAILLAIAGWHWWRRRERSAGL